MSNSIQHRRYIIARPEKSGAPLVRNGNVPHRSWPMTITARTVAGPSGTEDREVHLIIDNDTDLDILECGGPGRQGPDHRRVAGAHRHAQAAQGGLGMKLFYVLRTGGRSGGRFWDGPFYTRQRAESELHMTIDRANAFITEREEPDGDH